MALEQIAAPGRKIISFLALFADCFGRRDARRLLQVYVKKCYRCLFHVCYPCPFLEQQAWAWHPGF